MIPKYRAWGVERYPGLKQPASKMHRNVSVVTTYPEGITFILTNFSMQGDDEYSGSIIDDAILMQSTGLKDKNGKEIFEGDILDYKGRKALVRWHGSYASFIYRFVDEPHKRKAEWKPLYLAYMKCEIIGNIYENTELLEAIKCTQN